ncbi:MAG: glycine--tRNA ligase subunit beta [Planctomycetota bacterium]
MSDFLLELGTEEIPAGYIQPAIAQGVAFLKEFLEEHHLAYREIKTASTPRRMVFSITGLPDKQADINKELSGPPCSVAFDKDNKPTPAYYGFLKKNSLKESDVKTKDTPKGKVCYASVLVKGEKTEKILAEAVPGLVKSLPFPKSMWWLTRTTDRSGGEERPLTFARPLRYILSILGAKALKVAIPGVASGNKTFGHPFLSAKAVVIKSADFNRYQSALKQAKIIVDPAERRTFIEKEIQKALAKYNAVCDEPELLDEVTNLVEYPVAIECEFDESYLKLPAAVIESAMKSHQRYFPLKDKEGKLLNRFITVSNITANKEIKEGNERVLKARLSDALFFWEQDRKIPLEEYANNLNSLTFLGKWPMDDKVKRVRDLSLFIANGWCDDKKKGTIKRAAELCKADLLTGMVGEFPDLQGIMGYEYLKDKEHEVALAIKEHYQPRFTGDSLPESSAGTCLSLAEKFDNISSCFLLTLLPTGSSDPYGLRRQARAIVDIICARGLNIIHLRNTIKESFRLLVSPSSSVERMPDEVAWFIIERFKVALLEEGYPPDIVNAVLASGTDHLYHRKKLNDLLTIYTKEPQLWNELVEVVERTYNITKSAQVEGRVNEALLKKKEEIELWNVYKDNKDAIQRLIGEEKYEEASRLYHQAFAKPAHIFFEKVFVNVKEEDIKTNRLLLNRHINRLYSEGIADLSKIPRK